MRYAINNRVNVTGRSGLSPARVADRSSGPKKHRAHNRPPPGDRPAQPNGIVISMGPIDGDNLKDWVTFPVTPESIPVETAATWNSRQTLHGGETIGFGGKMLDVASFEGRLEPPDFYLVKPGQQPGIGTEIDERLLERLQNEALIRGPRFDVGSGDARVVMQEGARPGANYLEADAFVELLEAIEKDGEVVRLIIGDNFGWNHKAVITNFTWRFEDPDPDTILYSVTFKQHRKPKIQTGRAANEKPKSYSYTTRQGDTLEGIALRMWAATYKWQYLRTVNEDVLGDLWWYPDIGSTDKDWRQKGSVGHKIVGRGGGHQLGGGARSMPGDLPFRAGVTLSMQDVVENDEIDAADLKKKGGKKHHKHNDD